MRDLDADTLMALHEVVDVLDTRGDERHCIDLIDDLVELLAAELKCRYPKAPLDACDAYGLAMVRHALTLSRRGRGPDDDGGTKIRPPAPVGGVANQA